MKIRLLIIPFTVFTLFGCGSMYQGAMEKMGADVDKRETMITRVEEARDAQIEAKKQFQSALEKFQNMVRFEGGDLEREYEELKSTVQRCEERTEDVRARLKGVEEVSADFFDEWRKDIQKYDSDELRDTSREKLENAKEKYESMMAAMRQAKSRLGQTLIPFQDQVLYLQNNLNTKSVEGLSGELENIRSDVDELVKVLEKSIKQTTDFLVAIDDERLPDTAE